MDFDDLMRIWKRAKRGLKQSDPKQSIIIEATRLYSKMPARHMEAFPVPGGRASAEFRIYELANDPEISQLLIKTGTHGEDEIRYVPRSTPPAGTEQAVAETKTNAEEPPATPAQPAQKRKSRLKGMHGRLKKADKENAGESKPAKRKKRKER